MDFTFTLTLVFVCLILEAFFSGSEIALISVSRHKLSHLVEQGKKSAVMLEKQFQQPSRLYGTTSLGTNIFVFTGTAVLTAYISGVVDDKADLWASMIMAPVTLLFGEILPKVIFQRFADIVAYIVIYPLVMAQKIFSPALLVFSGITRMLLGKSKEAGEKGIHSHSQEEIRRLFSLGQKGFDLHPDEMMMINRIFDFRETVVEECMVSLINVAAVRQTEPISSVKARLNETKHSRLPVYADRIYNIIGFITAFDVLRSSTETAKARDLAHPAFYVYKKKKIGALLPEMQQGGIQVAVVVNEYGGAIGIVTREDLIEEIFGEIEDEYDEHEEPPVKELGIFHWEIDAMVEVDLLNDEYGFDFPVGEYETLAGLILTHVESIPEKGESHSIGEYTFLIKERTEKMLKKVEVFKTIAGGES